MVHRDPWQRLTRRCGTRRVLIRSAAGGLSLLGVARMPSGMAMAQGSTPCPETTTEEAIAVAEAYFDAFNNGDADALGALLAEQERAFHQERLLADRAAFPDGHADVQEIIANGDLVAVRHVFTGTLQGPFAGVEPAGQPVAVRGVHILRIDCGQIVESLESGDALGLMRQIGALPAPGPSPRTPLDQIATPVVAAGDCPPDTAEANADIGRRWTVDALDAHDLDVLNEFVAEDLIHHAGIFVDEIGRDALKEDLEALIAAFPDIRFTADVIVADEDGAAVRWTGRGTNDGPFQGLEPTGLPVEFTGINVYHIVCGQIVEGWSEPDSLGLLRQLGLVPEVYPGPATPTS
jgi:steroid delta-isomerase-like uncharacterized protein